MDLPAKPHSASDAVRHRLSPSAAYLHFRTARQALAAVLACIVMLSACSSAPTASKSTAGKYVSGSTAGYSLYQSASENRTFVTNAAEELTRRCMVKAGYQYWPMPLLPAQYRDPARPLSLADAKVRGYRALDLPTNAPGSAEREAYLSSLTPDQQNQYDLALGGDPNSTKTVKTPAGKLTFTTGGCRGQSFAQLLTDPNRYLSLDYQIANLTSLAEFDPEADPGLISATRAWSTCMTGSGYHFASPGKAIDAASKLDAAASANQNAALSDQPTPAARAIATADASCRATTNWDTANRVAVHNSLAVVADAHQADILTFNEMANNAAQKAKEILGR